MKQQFWFTPADIDLIFTALGACEDRLIKDPQIGLEHSFKWLSVRRLREMNSRFLPKEGETVNLKAVKKSA